MEEGTCKEFRSTPGSRERPCHSSMFRCVTNNKGCISDTLRCDGNNDCGDYSDEWDCAGETKRIEPL